MIGFDRTKTPDLVTQSVIGLIGSNKLPFLKGRLHRVIKRLNNIYARLTMFIVAIKYFHIINI